MFAIITSEYVTFHSATETCKDYNTDSQNYDFTCCFVRF